MANPGLQYYLAPKQSVRLWSKINTTKPLKLCPHLNGANCQKHGHQKYQCKNKTSVCAFCAKTPTDLCYQVIQSGKTVIRKCANCHGNHPVSCNQCHEYLKVDGHAPAPGPKKNPWENRPHSEEATTAAPNQTSQPTHPIPPICSDPFSICDKNVISTG